MTDLKHYLQDGANNQARAVMCMVQTPSPEWLGVFIANMLRYPQCRPQMTSQSAEAVLHLPIDLLDTRNGKLSPKKFNKIWILNIKDISLYC